MAQSTVSWHIVWITRCQIFPLQGYLKNNVCKTPFASIQQLNVRIHYQSNFHESFYYGIADALIIT